MPIREKKQYPLLHTNRLELIFKKYPEIEAVFLFGSAASEKTHMGSDIDLAVLPNNLSIIKKKLDILEDLARSGFCNVDLVFLKGDDIVLQYEAVRPRRLVYQKQTFNLGAVYSKVMREYFDFYPYLAVQRKAYKKRILNGTG